MTIKFFSFLDSLIVPTPQMKKPAFIKVEAWKKFAKAMNLSSHKVRNSLFSIKFSRHIKSLNKKSERQE